MREIVTIAAESFATVGFDRTNFDDIAARLGMRGASLYHYVESKDALFVECVEVTTRDVLERLASVVDPEARAVDNLQALFREQVIVQLRDYPQFAAVFYRIVHPETEIQETIRRLRSEHTQVFRRAAKAMVDEGTASEERWQLALMLATGALAHMVEWYRPDGRQTLEALAEETARDLIGLVQAGS